jgi:hypothetical protein
MSRILSRYIVQISGAIEIALLVLYYQLMQDCSLMQNFRSHTGDPGGKFIILKGTVHQSESDATRF